MRRGRRQIQTGATMRPHLAFVGGEDHNLRIPFLLALQRSGYRVTAVSPGSGEAFARAGIEHAEFRFDRFSSGVSELRALSRLRHVLAGLAPDLVQSFDTKPNLLVPLALRGAIPVVRTINGVGWVFSSSAPRALALRPVYIGLQRLVSRWTATVVFQNHDDQAMFRRLHLTGRSRSVLISSSGIDVEPFLEAKRRGVRDAASLGTGRVVMFVGRLTREKGIPTLLAAVPLVRATFPDVRFLLVGPRDSEGPFAVGADAIDRLAPSVVALGPRDDVPALLGRADVFVLPTEYREGVPRVLLEAGLAGVPIVASRMPGCTDVVRDGWNGYLVEPGKPAELAARILDLLGAPEQASEMGRRSVALIRERFALEVVVQSYADMYETIFVK